MTKFKPKKRRQISVRLNALFVLVFLLFAALILKLGIVQIAQGDHFKEELTKTTSQVAHMDAPRGKMFDRFGHVLVDNNLELSLTYTNPGGVKAEDMLELAKEVAQLIELDVSKVRERDQREYYYTTLNEKERKKLLPKKDVKPKDEYKEIIKAIPDEVLEGLSDEENEVATIFGRMASGMTGEPQRIKQNLTEPEQHKIAERLDTLPHMDLQRDASRAYVYGSTFKQAYGRVGQIPIEDADSYLAKGYKRSDYVGTSYLEAQYEDVLRGKKAEVASTFTRQGRGPSESEIEEKLGSRGNDLELTIDMAYQQKLDEIVKSTVNANSYVGNRSAYAIVMDPKTGDILAMSGYIYDRDKKEGYHNEIGVINAAFEPGSAIKGASVLTGFETGVFSPGEGVDDKQLKFKGTQPKKSHTYLGYVNHLSALERSSNTYMFHVAMRMADYQYVPDKSFISVPHAQKVLDKVRYYFNQFGLGADTGIDLPNASSGLMGTLHQGESGKLLDMMIGQYDTYSTLQLGQYVSTIANDGVRMRPRLVQSVLEPSPDGEGGTVQMERPPEVLNRVDMSIEHIREVQKGFRLVTGSNGTAKDMRTSVNVPFAAKTGTAQVGSFYNVSFVGYAPYDDPEIAFAVIAPGVTHDKSPAAKNISKNLINDYFDLKEDRKAPKEVDEIIEEVDMSGN
ncbi:peptidoglycan D,D-transpeptidase FtsI family protein [Shouchella lonarensis]|uniref:serine-type D-Ala-D-Ala carboxypeptidase n=1 Tax=Shouchella lonarensis TaxID=1464122 RepID=A0A1G6KPA4_9BACI|nr:penicillin-binding protein 2 [Shouchella lonarensis]SDC32880.1 cell elongation-specific peptidoglycan D,D-transpeptidase [Shouchella lonarensis]